ncbi:MAG: hypothetical protein KGN84_03955 [Acidobacteriota bacterium]|nr:hypothetical protein [Acidobacteriota bacterium]
MAESLKDVIASLEKQKAAIEKALEALRDVEGLGAPRPGRPKGSGAKRARGPSSNRGRISPEGRRKLAEAMKRRWAVKRAAATAKKAAKK